MMVSADWKGNILVWNAVYTIVRKIKEPKQILAVVFHPTQKKIIFGGGEKKLKCLDIDNQNSKAEEMATTKDEIKNIGLNKDGTKI